MWFAKANLAHGFGNYAQVSERTKSLTTSQDNVGGGGMHWERDRSFFFSQGLWVASQVTPHHFSRLSHYIEYQEGA